VQQLLLGQPLQVVAQVEFKSLYIQDQLKHLLFLLVALLFMFRFKGLVVAVAVLLLQLIKAAVVVVLVDMVKLTLLD
jgi:hypothetical protein